MTKKFIHSNTSHSTIKDALNFKIMLQDSQTIRFYQKLTDAMLYLWQRGYSFDELRLYTDGYIACLRHSNTLEAYHIHRLEEEAFRFLRDPSNFELPMPQTYAHIR